MRELVELLIAALVGSRKGWEIKERLRDDGTIVLELYAGEAELRAIIGKGGEHIAAVRTLLRGAQVGSERRYVLETRPL